ncbi:hypothetical protein RJ639_019865 [Escallonia herrerae]|uniref:Reverse transcriptase Ty1/copia-type domain-containing protein n=1 Tax=Escallonia herrerae TaxID=1293975 RepID=A0AA88VAI0_9ASTE|nr:hypothetical protein RJ639_019865 [Escallonia herrerae]
MAPNTSTKYDLEKFDGSNDFSLWRMKIRAVLIQQRLLKALKENKGFLIRCGVMRIMKGALVVIKELKQNSLYLLQGSTVTGAAGTASSSNVDSDTTKLWHMHVGHTSERGYTKSAYDNCVYHQKLTNGSHIYLLYVDDMLIAAKSMSDVNNLKEQLKREFEMKDLGAAKRILDMEIQRDRPAGILHLSQKKYIERVLQCFGMKNSKPVTTPLAAHFKLPAADSPQTQEKVEHIACVPYASATNAV